MTNDLAGFGAVAIGLIGTTIIAKETIKLMRDVSKQPRRTRGRKQDYNPFRIRI